MSVTDKGRSVTLVLPEPIYKKAIHAAGKQGKPVEEFLQRVLTDDLRDRAHLRARWEQLSRQYRARLQREGTLDQTADEVLADLRELREQVVDELYPG